MTPQSYDVSMQKMFAAVSDLYARYWGDFFHFAIFDHPGQTWEDALAKTHDSYMHDLCVADAKSILELACGRGGFSNLMAQNTPGDVLGIDISESQLSHARRHQRPNLRFKQHDIMNVDDLGMTFDAVCFLDAACYLPDKHLAVRKIRKVMRPGARFLLVEWCRHEDTNAAQQALVLAPFMKYWGVPYLETRARYEQFLDDSGFQLLDVQDLNDRVAPNWELGYQNALKAVAELSIGDLPGFIWKGMTLGSEGIRLIKEQFPAAVYIKVGFDSGCLRYVFFLAEAV
ncbi:MAG TPA: methyltransferase domain-containing protein [Phycisphaerae bacterium]|nr:methyltransferase domain-containing protein [Phycisphaerae bacterium]